MTQTLGLFEGYGLELEYMIVDQETLDVRPIADELLKQVGGGYEMEVDVGPVAWSNELALHVIEIKSNGPAKSIAGLGATFQQHIGKIEALLKPMGARLMPTGMHPWMDPAKELKLWPHEDRSIYDTFDRIFDCRGHGWANLQSTHINLPFSNDEEFGKLHAAIRMVLPILPALAASSPLTEGRYAGFADHRLEVYRHNADRVFSVMGHVVPERVYTRADYEARVLGRIYDDMADLDPEGVLRHEWVNARGCIARFDRMALEIRVLDIQECPLADMAVAATVTAVVRALCEERWCSSEAQKNWDEARLAKIFQACVRDADQAEITDDEYLACFGLHSGGPLGARALWQQLIDETFQSHEARAEWQDWFDTYLDHGSLASRIHHAVGREPSTETVRETYRSLCDALQNGRVFVGESLFP